MYEESYGFVEDNFAVTNGKQALSLPLHRTVKISSNPNLLCLHEYNVTGRNSNLTSTKELKQEKTFLVFVGGRYIKYVTKTPLKTWKINRELQS